VEHGRHYATWPRSPADSLPDFSSDLLTDTPSAVPFGTHSAPSVKVPLPIDWRIGFAIDWLFNRVDEMSFSGFERAIRIGAAIPGVTARRNHMRPSFQVGSSERTDPGKAVVALGPNSWLTE
jgi:hypothetical protein